MRGVAGETAGYAYDRNGVLFGLCFWGKSAKPLWHYRFKTSGELYAKIDQTLANYEAHKAHVAERRQKRVAEACKTPLDVWRKAQAGDGWLSTADVAVLVRAALAKAFPGQAFSVRSDNYSGGSSIDVQWSGGPEPKDVQRVAGAYSMAGFDGMIDMKYNISLWLSPDGRVALAHSPGTMGSAGSDPEAIGDPNHPQAVLIRGGADFVQCQRHYEPQTA